jgi:hypothetical protein
MVQFIMVAVITTAGIGGGVIIHQTIIHQTPNHHPVVAQDLSIL